MQIEKYDPPNKRFTGDSANCAQSLSGAFSHNLQSGRYPVADKIKETTQPGTWQTASDVLQARY